MDHARPLIDRWIDFHSRTGFAEWDSVNYYPCNLAALLNLVDFAADEVLSTRAAMLVDLLLFDLAVDSFTVNTAPHTVVPRIITSRVPPEMQ